MMYNDAKLFRWIERISVALSIISVFLLFVNLFFSLLIAASGAFISSIGMFIYLLKKENLTFSKLLFYALLISSASILIIFFKTFKI